MVYDSSFPPCGFENVIVFLETILATEDDSYFVDVDLEYTDAIEIETRFFSLVPESKNVDRVFH